MNNSRRGQSGLALVTVLLVVAIVGSMAAFLALDQEVWVRQTGNQTRQLESEQLLRGAMDFATLVLERDRRDNDTDHRGEAWSLALPAFPIEGGTIAIKAQDAQGLFNLNNLLKAGQPSVPDVAVFNRMVTLPGFPSIGTDSLIDWLDTDSSVRPGGAEDNDYLAADPPRRSANALLGDIDELRAVRGFPPAAVALLYPIVTALPQRTAVNLNTAPPEVLYAVFPKLDPDGAQRLAESLASRPATTLEDLRTLLGDQYEAPRIVTAFRSRYFIIDIAVTLGEYRNAARYLVDRDAQPRPLVLARTRIPVVVAPADDSQ